MICGIVYLSRAACRLQAARRCGLIIDAEMCLQYIMIGDAMLSQSMYIMIAGAMYHAYIMIAGANSLHM